MSDTYTLQDTARRQNCKERRFSHLQPLPALAPQTLFPLDLSMHSFFTDLCSSNVQLPATECCAAGANVKLWSSFVEACAIHGLCVFPVLGCCRLFVNSFSMHLGATMTTKNIEEAAGRQRRQLTALLEATLLETATLCVQRFCPRRYAFERVGNRYTNHSTFCRITLRAQAEV